MDLSNFFRSYQDVQTRPTVFPEQSMVGIREMYMKGLFLICSVLLKEPPLQNTHYSLWVRLPHVKCPKQAETMLSEILSLDKINWDGLPSQSPDLIAERLLTTSSPFPWAQVTEELLQLSMQQASVQEQTLIKEALIIIRDSRLTVADLPTMSRTIPYWNRMLLSATT